MATERLHSDCCRCPACLPSAQDDRNEAARALVPGRRPIIIESPFMGDEELHKSYLREVIRYALELGYTPYASHGLLPGALDDSVPEERALGIAVGIDMRDFVLAHGGEIAFAVDLGWSEGMTESRASLAEGACFWEWRLPHSSLARVYTSLGRYFPPSGSNAERAMRIRERFMP